MTSPDGYPVAAAPIRSLRLVLSLLLACLAATVVFTLAWIRLPPDPLNLLRILVSYGFFIGFVTFLIGLPLALFIEKQRIGWWYVYTAVGAAAGGGLPALLVTKPTNIDGIQNPFSLVFSPWTRDRPGFAEEVPVTVLDYLGSIAFGSLVGAVLGFTFWYCYSRRRPRPR